jgi:hypothetical protein
VGGVVMVLTTSPAVHVGDLLLEIGSDLGELPS